MRPKTYLDAPARMCELWSWVAAVCAHDYGDSAFQRFIRLTGA